MKERIQQEGAGIFNWAHEGLLRLQERGRFEVPESVRSATDDWQEKNDVAATFVEDACDVGEDYKVSGSELYRAYRNWAIENGFKPKASNKVSDDWLRLGFENKKETSGKDKDKMFWHGLRVKFAVVEDQPGSPGMFGPRRVAG